jgi:hypothetical protein
MNCCNNIQKSAFLALLASLVILNGCKKVSEKVDDLTTIRPEFSTIFIIPVVVPANDPYDLLTPDIANTASSQSSLVRKASLEKTTLSIESPTGQTFRFIKSIRFFLQADGLPDIEVANRENIDNSVGNTLELTMTGAELREYLKKEKYRLKTTVVVDEVITQPVKIKASLTFAVVVLV